MDTIEIFDIIFVTNLSTIASVNTLLLYFKTLHNHNKKKMMVNIYVQGSIDMIVLDSGKGFPVNVPPITHLVSYINIGYIM